MPARRAAESLPLVLTLNQRWDSSYGGIATFNRELSIGRAELGHHVTARISHPAAEDPRVHLSVAPRVAGIDDDRAYLLNPAGLPAAVDIVIGHSRFSGGPAGVIRDAHYPQASLVHVVHTSPELLGRLQNHPDLADRNADNERALISRADLVVGIGPLLFEEAARLARQASLHPPPVHQFIPGVPARPVPAYPAQSAGNRRHLLLFGRVNDPLKGAPQAADIVRALRNRGWDVQLTIRGAAAADRNQQERELSQRAGTPVWVKPFTADTNELAQELRGTDVVLVSALHEDFGLVATETAGAGVPFLVGGHTGVGRFLSDPHRVPQELAAASVVPDLSTNVQLWADRIDEAFRDLDLQRDRAKGLQKYLTRTYIWKGAAAALVEALTITQATAARRQKLRELRRAFETPVGAQPGRGAASNRHRATTPGTHPSYPAEEPKRKRR